MGTMLSRLWAQGDKGHPMARYREHPSSEQMESG